MKFAYLVFPLGAISAPTVFTSGLIYDASHPLVLFTDKTCTISQSLTQGEPLSFAFPTSAQLGLVLGSILYAILGPQVTEGIDQVADDLCINAQQEPGGGNGICQDIFQLILDFVTAILPVSQAAKYQCLLNALCIAPTGPTDVGTCNFFLAGSDCIANRLVGTMNLECTGSS